MLSDDNSSVHTAIYPSISRRPVTIGSAPEKPAPQPPSSSSYSLVPAIEWRETTADERSVSWLSSRSQVVRLNFCVFLVVACIVCALSVRVLVLVFR